MWYRVVITVVFTLEYHHWSTEIGAWTYGVCRYLNVVKGRHKFIFRCLEGYEVGAAYFYTMSISTEKFSNVVKGRHKCNPPKILCHNLGVWKKLISFQNVPRNDV